jgi:phage terminase large subunit-like protein
MSTAEQRESARKRQQNKRDRDAGLPETYPVIKISAKERAEDAALQIALTALDESEKYYHKSECRSRIECFNLYCAWARGRKILGKKRSYDEWIRLRDLSRRNLFFLAKYLLGFKRLLYRVHKPVCDMFVRKNFRNTYHKEYDLEDVEGAFWRMRETRFKNALILDPRAWFKTSLNIADVVQWLINCPDVKILLLTAENKRSTDLLDAVKRYFKNDESHLTNFQLLFPEYLTTGVASTSSQPLDCPARKQSLVGVDHTLWVKSQSSQKTGSHADVVKRDDIVTPENSTSPELRIAVQESADDTANLVLEHGFIDTIGTRYVGGKDPDYYGVMLKREAESDEVDKDLKYFVRSCWAVKPEYSNVRLQDLTLDMVDLIFPEHGRSPAMTFKGLRRKLLDNERSFRNQQLNEPIDSSEDSAWVNEFTLESLRATCYPRESAPKNGKILGTWDFAYKDKARSDYSCGVVITLYQRPEDGQCAICVLDVSMDKWPAKELVYEILKFHARYKPETVMIEQALGSEFLEIDLKNESLRRGSDFPGALRWYPIKNTDDIKRKRFKNLSLLHKDGRLHFVNGLWMDKCFEQLCSYEGKKSTGYRKDDFIDALGLCIEFLPKTALMSGITSEEAEREMEKMQREANKVAWYKRTFGGGSASPVAPAPAPVVPERDPRKSMMDKILPPGMRT